jgi:hypothetical protein
LGIGDWGLGIGPNPQSPIPFPYLNLLFELSKEYMIIQINNLFYN